jgi:ABC-2 type transport system permease protein
MAIPLFFFISFTGALGAVGTTTGFNYYNFTAFIFVFVLYQAVIFAGVFASIDIAADYGSGIGNRMMLSAPRRLAILGGYLMVALTRAALAIAVLWGVALAIRMPVRGDALDIVGLVGLAFLLSIAATLWGAGVALRFRSVESGVLIMIPTFMIMFLTPVFVPRDKLSGWLKTVSGWNPLTSPIEAGRGFLAHDPVHVTLAFASAAGLVVFFGIWAIRGMHKAERASGGRRARGRPGRGRRRRGRPSRRGAASPAA